jgi:hypothetical protein
MSEDLFENQIIYINEDDVLRTVKAAVHAHYRKEAEADGIKFNPGSRRVRVHVQMAYSEALDELGFSHPPEEKSAT